MGLWVHGVRPMVDESSLSANGVWVRISVFQGFGFTVYSVEFGVSGSEVMV